MDGTWYTEVNEDIIIDYLNFFTIQAIAKILLDMGAQVATQFPHLSR